MSRLYLDPVMIDRGRELASDIAEGVSEFVMPRTTTAIERTVLRLFGVDGVDADGVPLPNRAVDAALRAGTLGGGIAGPFANGVLQTGFSPQELGEALADGEVDLASLPRSSETRIQEQAKELAEAGLARIAHNRERRDELLRRLGEGPRPHLYVIVATGNIFEDVVQARAAAMQGADIIAVIRSTGQSLLDYLPYGATTEGFGGTFATQENFRIMRAALDEASEETGRYVRLCNYCSGLAMPEIAAAGALERLDVMLNDALYGILFRDINMKRTLVDQHFSRMINAFAGVVINTGEDNYLTTADAVEAAHTVLASQFINEQLALRSGLEPWQMGLGHAFEMDPGLEDGLLLEWAQAMMAREIFPDAPLKYMPPTKHMTGNIFRGHVQDALFNLVGAATGQGIQLLGMMTEAIHTPLLQDRYLAIESARYIFRNARHLQDELEFRADGRMVRRAAQVLSEAVDLLERTRDKGFFAALSEGFFADVRRNPDGGRGLQGVIQKEPGYFNPVEDALRRELGLSRERRPAGGRQKEGV